MRVEDQSRSAKQHRVKIVSLDLHMVLALTICPTCGKEPTKPCALYGSSAPPWTLIHGARLNRLWGMAGFDKCFNVDRFYGEALPNNAEWMQVEPGSQIDQTMQLYVDARLRKHHKPRRRRRG